MISACTPSTVMIYKMSEERQITVSLPKEDRPPPQGANYFHFTWLGTDIQMLAGYIDLDRLRESVSKDSEGTSNEVSLEVSNRFSMSVTSFFRLRDQVNDLVSKMASAGVEIPGSSSESFVPLFEK